MRRTFSVDSLLRPLSNRPFRWPFIKALFRNSSVAVNGQSTPNLVEILSALSEIPLRYSDKRAALERIIELCQQAMGSRACMVTFVDPANDTLPYGGGTSPDKEFEDFMNRIQARPGPHKDVYVVDRDLLRTGKGVEVYELLKDGKGIAHPNVATKYNPQAGLYYPLQSDGQLLGYLCHFPSKHSRFAQAEHALFKIFADQSVNVIERFEQYQTRDRLSKILDELPADLLSLPLPEFLNRVAETACQLLTVPICIVWTLDTSEENLRVAAATGNVDEKYRKLELSREQFSQWFHLSSDKIAYLKDVRKWHRRYFHAEDAEKRGWVSLLSAPLRAEGRLIGMLDVYTERQSRRFKPWEREAFYGFANYAALAMQKARLQERQLVAEIRGTIDRPSGDAKYKAKPGNELNYTLHRIVAQCAAATQAKTCYLRLWNKATDELELVARYDSSLQERNTSYNNKLKVGHGVAGLVAQTGKPHICPDTTSDPQYAGAHEGERPLSTVCIPLKSGDAVIGTLSIGSERKNAFGSSEQQLLESIADSVVVAIERAHLMDSLLRLAESAATSASLEDLLEHLVDLTRELMRAPVCLVWLLDKDRDGFVVKSARFPDNHTWNLKDVVVKNAVPNLQKFLRRTEPLYVEDIAKVPEHPYRDKILPWGWKSALGMALVVQGQPVGFLGVYSCDEVRNFTGWHCELFKTFAAQASIAIENVTSRYKLRRLNELFAQMGDIREVDAVLQLLLEGSLSLAGCTRGMVSKLNYKTGEQDIVDYKGPQLQIENVKLGTGITGKALQDETSQRVDNVNSPEWYEIYYKQWEDTQSELAIPIVVSNAEVRTGNEVALGSKPLGVLNIESPTRAAFSPADADLLLLLGRQAALVINRIEFDRKLARLQEFQQSILLEKNLDDIVHRTTQGIADTLDFEYVHIALVDHERGRIKTEHVVGITDHELAEFKQKAMCTLDDNNILADVVRSGEIVISLGEGEGLNTQEPQNLHQGHGLRVYVPMISPKDNRILGIVEAGHRKIHWKYIYERDVQTLCGFADYAVRALEHVERDLLEKMEHEFTAPITGIRNNASVLQRRFTQLSDNVRQKKIEDVLADCELLLHQVSKLRYVLDRKSPTSKKKYTWVFRDIIVKTIHQLKPFAQEKGLNPIRMRYQDEDIPKIRLYVDREKLNEVVYNLLTNAIKYAGNDPSAFDISISVDETKNDFIVKFSDEGIGIELGFEEKIFERGFRTPDAFRRHVTGTGLGLTIARDNARELGGDLLLANNRQPTEFHLILPKSLKEVPDGKEANREKDSLRR